MGIPRGDKKEWMRLKAACRGGRDREKVTGSLCAQREAQRVSVQTSEVNLFTRGSTANKEQARNETEQGERSWLDERGVTGYSLFSSERQRVGCLKPP